MTRQTTKDKSTNKEEQVKKEITRTKNEDCFVMLGIVIVISNFRTKKLKEFHKIDTVILRIIIGYSHRHCRSPCISTSSSPSSRILGILSSGALAIVHVVFHIWRSSRTAAVVFTSSPHGSHWILSLSETKM